MVSSLVPASRFGRQTLPARLAQIAANGRWSGLGAISPAGNPVTDCSPGRRIPSARRPVEPALPKGHVTAASRRPDRRCHLAHQMACIRRVTARSCAVAWYVASLVDRTNQNLSLNPTVSMMRCRSRTSRWNDRTRLARGRRDACGRPRKTWRNDPSTRTGCTCALASCACSSG